MAHFFFEEEPVEAPAKEQPSPSPIRPALSTLFEYVELFAITAVVILLVTLFCFRHAVVDGDSMNATLSDKEHLLVYDLFYSPKQGDIIVFESEEETGLAEPLVKRVIATEGQTVAVFRDRIEVDGKALDEPYAYLFGSNFHDYLSYGHAYGVPSTVLDGEECFLYRVGEDEVFVMGDNRFNSYDGRMFGPISEDCVLGKVLLRILPLREFGGV